MEKIVKRITVDVNYTRSDENPYTLFKEAPIVVNRHHHIELLIEIKINNVRVSKFEKNARFTDFDLHDETRCCQKIIEQIKEPSSGGISYQREECFLAPTETEMIIRDPLGIFEWLQDRTPRKIEF